MSALSTPKLVLRRIRNAKMLLASIFLGILFATTLAAAVPIYLGSLERLALNLEIDRLGRFQSKLLGFAYYIPFTKQRMADTDRTFGEVVDEHIAEIYVDHRRFVTGLEFYAEIPSIPLPPADVANGSAARAFLKSLSDFHQHVTLVEGRLPQRQRSDDPNAPVLEAVLGEFAASQFRIEVGDVLRLTPDLTLPKVISVPIVGIIEPTDPNADFWLPTPSLYLRPEAPDPDDPGDGIYNPEIPPVPLITDMGTLVETVDKTFPGTLSISIWTISLDKEVMKGWTPDRIRSSFREFEAQFAMRMPGAAEVSSGFYRMLARFDSRSFFARVPLLLLQTLMVASVLFFLVMMVSYLVRSRQADSALLSARGVSTSQIFRIYALEGLVMTVIAVIVAPFLAVAGVALAGVLPFFREMTSGDLLPLVVGPMPFLVAAATGLACLVVYAIPAAVGTRGGLLLHKLRSARPPSIPFVHRYYLDVGFLVLGGIIFWELYNRGKILSGGLFRNVEVNEVLLLAPIIFLLVVALLFLRVFPILLRFIAGESSELSHLLLALAVVPLAVGIPYREIRQDPLGGEWVGPIVILTLVVAAYLFTTRSVLLRYRIAGYAAQAGLIFWFLSEEPLRNAGVLAPPSVLLMTMVPIQLAFVFFSVGARFTPAPVSIGLRYVSRNPLQYSWLVLLLVMTTGVGVLATTVGGTLERGQSDQAQYDAGSDVRISLRDSVFLSQFPIETLLERYEAIPGVRTASPAYREPRFGRPDGVEVFAVDSREFPFLAWYREDFSEQPLAEIMRSLNAHPPPEVIVLPEDSTEIAIWTKLQRPIEQLWMQVILQEGDGNLSTLSLGELWEAPPNQSTDSDDFTIVIPDDPPEPQWKLMSRAIPARLEHPLSLVSVQLYESRVGTLTPGALLIDNIHVETASSNEHTVLEDFEGLFRWTPIITSGLAPDRLYSFGGDAKDGDRSAMFRFGQEGQRGVRGVYLSPTGGELPVAVSTGFQEAVGVEVGDLILMNAGGRAIPSVVRSVVDHFPTMRPSEKGFILADLNALHLHANIISPINRLRPNEVFLSVSPAAHELVVERVNSISLTPGTIYDRLSQVETARLDPLTTAGWTSMVFVAVGIILITIGIGYATYLLAFLDRSKGETGFLRSLGLSNGQLLGLLAFEHLAILLVGIGLGAWAGFQMSQMAVSSVVIVSPDDVLPPYTSITDWGFLLPMYLGILVVVLVSFVTLIRTTRRIDLQTISRMEG
ncbi:MAG: FtsX-like permease family protein [Chloroflexi bacterium]|nr:FtsX-like permease family protein [Chloroflexota bacterium]